MATNALAYVLVKRVGSSTGSTLHFRKHVLPVERTDMFVVGSRGTRLGGEAAHLRPLAAATERVGSCGDRPP